MRTSLAALVATTLAGSLVVAQGTRVTMTFAPQNKDQRFEAAAAEYREIWAAEGARIIPAMEQITTLKFPEKNVKVEVYEGTSFSGRGGAPMRLRASYPRDIKKGVVVHELGHRMIGQLRKRPVGLDEHQLLFLFLYDLWENLYGKDFADREVAFERTLKGLYDYDGTWTSTLSMSRDERMAKFKEVLKINGK